MNDLAVDVRSYLTQKLGSDRNECEDALGFNTSSKAFAVADGATEAYGSRYWARILVKSWIRRPIIFPRSQFLDFVRLLGERATSRWSNKQLPWYAEEKARAGSFAAFVGVLFDCDGDRIRWRVLAIGDSCFIHTRRGEIVCSVPLSEPEQFSYRPVLLPSNPSAQSLITEEGVREYEGIAQAGDMFFLLSDAVASWFLAAKKSNVARANEFERLIGGGLTSDLDIFFDEQRASDQMRNDDIAALCVRLVETGS
jgi:hypothetical protein